MKFPPDGHPYLPGWDKMNAWARMLALPLTLIAVCWFVAVWR